MKNIRVNYQLPTTYDTGEALPKDQIKHVEIFSSVNPETLGWTLVASVLPDVTTHLIPELESGVWHFRGIVVDLDGHRSEPRDASIEIPHGNPGPLVNFTVTIE